jgi:hypothetical protein
MPAASAPPLHERLLHAAPAPSERAPERRWAYPPAGVLLVSAFVLYHAAVLLIWNGPGRDLARPFQSAFLQHTHGYEYFRSTRNDQSWAMFAPNPDRTNNFVQVLVITHDDTIWDFQQDIWGQDRYPYLWYDRRGKVNRNIDGKKHDQRVYGAWVCREWERQHGGESARAVRFVKRWTDIPEPEQVLRAGGWRPWDAPFKVFEQETIPCETIPHGTLPDELRVRYGLPLLDDPRRFVPVDQPTWAGE